MELCYRWARGSRENEKKKKNQESAGQPVCLLQICNSSVTLFEQTLPPSLSSMPPLSVNPPPPIKKQMFHHRGTSTRGCLTRQMECLLLLLGRQQTAGWESSQEERQESQSECQLAGLRLQRRCLPTHWKAHTGARNRTHMRISMRAHATPYHTCDMHKTFTLSRCPCSESERWLRTRTRARPESPGSTSFHSAGLWYWGWRNLLWITSGLRRAALARSGQATLRI